MLLTYDILNCYLIENNASQTYLNALGNVIGLLDDLLFWMKQYGFKFIESVSWSMQTMQKGAMFWSGKMICID